jgi:membrane-associated protease RseP (regulator of RpoE activity)
MRVSMRIALLLVMTAAAPALMAQTTQTHVINLCGGKMGEEAGNRAVLGLGTTAGSPRDTLGILISTVTPNGPAEKAGLEEGDRIANINGVDVRQPAGDVGDRETAGLMTHRLTRILEKLKAGDVAELKVYYNGATRTVKVTTGKASDVFANDGMLQVGSMDFNEAFDGSPMKPALERLRRLRLQLPPTPSTDEVIIDDGPHRI